MKIAIIGGGYTGLTAAYELQKEGHEITIFEANSDLGGLASGFKIEGEYIERTYHHLFRTDTDILQMVDELGLQEEFIWQNSSVGIFYEGKIYSFMSPFDLIKFSPLSFLDRIKTGLTLLYLQKEKRWQKFENVSAYKWISRTGKSSLKVIWEPLLKGKFSNFYQDVSMAWLWARLHIRANSRKAGDAKEKLGYFKGGFQVFTNRLVEKLSKVDIKLSTKIERIVHYDEKIEIEYNGSKQIFDKVIATVPSNVFAHMIKNNKSIKPEYIDQLMSINYLGAIVSVFSSTQDIGEYYWNNINDLNKPFLVFINHTKLIDKTNYNNKYIYYIGTYLPNDHKYFEMDQSQIEKEWFDALKEIFKDFDTSQINEKHMFKFKNAQHVVDSNYKSKIPEYQTPLKNVYLSNFSQIYPEDRGTNFAIREGKKIAKLVMGK